MHRKLIYPKSGQFWVSTMNGDILVTPQNKDFDPDHIIARLEDLDESGETHAVVDGDALSLEERKRIYFEEAAAAVHNAGNRYSIRQVFGSRKNVGSDNLGTNVPVLIVFENREPVDVYPHRLADATHRTIREYIDAL
jgi:hypothetical protein